MHQELARKAIKAALSNDWNTAIDLNLKILDSLPSDTEALNRISQAYIQTGNIKDAKVSAEKVVEIDPLNPIAKRCMARCSALMGKDIDFVQQISGNLEQIFIEEPGRTKIVSLINVCEPTIIAMLNPGDEVKLVTKTHKIIANTVRDSYIGRLPDDIAHRMIYLMDLGNKYVCNMKSASFDSVRLFIREAYKVSEFEDKHSFPPKR